MTAVMRIPFARNIKRFAIFGRGFLTHGNEEELSLRINPAADQPCRSHTVHTDIFPGNPFHDFSPRFAVTACLYFKSYVWLIVRHLVTSHAPVTQVLNEKNPARPLVDIAAQFPASLLLTFQVVSANQNIPRL